VTAAFDPTLRIKTLEYELNHAHLVIQSLQEQLRLQRIQFLGPRSETLSNLQLQLLLEEEPGVTLDEVAAEANREPIPNIPPRERKRKPHPGRQRLPEHLPRVENVIPCATIHCEACGEETTVIGYDESEVLDTEPVHYFVRVTKREKRACRCCQQGTVTMPELEPRIIDKGLASDRIVVDTVIAKYCDHLPLYRQAAMLEREAGLEIGRATLDGWVMQVGGLLGQVVAAMRNDLLPSSATSG
jgi:transposase